MIAKIALNLPHAHPYDYLLPPRLAARALPGQRALVPLGGRLQVGVLTATAPSSSVAGLKEVLDLEEEPFFDGPQLELLQWMSDYYLCSLGILLERAQPAGLKPGFEDAYVIQRQHADWLALESATQEALSAWEEKPLPPLTKLGKLAPAIRKGKKLGYLAAQARLKSPQLHLGEEIIELLVSLEEIKTKAEGKPAQLKALLAQKPKLALPELQANLEGVSAVLKAWQDKGWISRRWQEPTQSQAPASVQFLALNQEQQKAFGHIQQALQTKRFRPFLLHGITGSGKTEVYLHGVQACLEQGRQALILIPEISLTPQAVARFAERFGQQIAVLHSGLSDLERAKEWLKVKQGLCPIVIGARSAVFAPLSNLGLVVVDEEHDGSYKQQESPFYHARDLAVKMAADRQAVVILGSATPSVESYHHAREGKYQLLELNQRANLNPLPQLEVINLKDPQVQSVKGVFYLSVPLLDQLKENFQLGRQAILFLNRRGFASLLACTREGCEEPFLCKNCSIAMTWHQAKNRLICHYCGFHHPWPKTCPSCGGDRFSREGFGTQRVERDLKVLFPKARILRMDRDTVSRRGELEQRIEQISNQEVDFIIGTQLISKGHDFKAIGLVCLLLADMGLNIPDFRSSERGFQLISQVSGRAGRGEDTGAKSLLQSFNPDLDAIRFALDHDYVGFFASEIEKREAMFDPPFSRLVLLRFSHPKQQQAETAAQQMGEVLRQQMLAYRFLLLGPIESPLSRLQGRFYFQILLKSDQPGLLKQLLRQIVWNPSWRPAGGARLSIDVDPQLLA